MARTVVIDELHITIRVPVDLSDAEADTVRRTLLSHSFMDRLRRAVRTVVRVFPELAWVRVTYSR